MSDWKICKYPINNLLQGQPEVTVLSIPEGARFLCLQLQFGEPYIWMQCNMKRPVVDRIFHFYGTGHPCPSLRKSRYMGTLQARGGDIVLHLLEEIADAGE